MALCRHVVESRPPDSKTNALRSCLVFGVLPALIGCILFVLLSFRNLVSTLLLIRLKRPELNKPCNLFLVDPLYTPYLDKANHFELTPSKPSLIRNVRNLAEVT